MGHPEVLEALVLWFQSIVDHSVQGSLASWWATSTLQAIAKEGVRGSAPLPHLNHQ